MLSFIVLSVIMLSVIMQTVVMPTVVLLSVVAPIYPLHHGQKKVFFLDIENRSF
jgi:hypothetical protein